MKLEILNVIYVHTASTIIYLLLIVYSLYKIKTDEEYKPEFCKDYYGRYQKPKVRQVVFHIILAFIPLINSAVVVSVFLDSLLYFIFNTTFFKKFIDLMNKEI